MRHPLPLRGLRLTGSGCALLGAILVCVGASGCSSAQDPGQVRFLVHATPPPDDELLSPLTDLRVSAIELRDGASDAVLGRSRFDPTPAGLAMESSLDLGMVNISSEPRDLRMLAVGSAGQQVLGLGLYRGASWQFGQNSEFVLEMRRPLFFFGGSAKLTPLVQPDEAVFAPNKQLYAPLKDETKLRVIDPNSVTPLLPDYDRQFDGTTQPVGAAAGTFDGQSILAASLAGNLHVVDTLRLEIKNSVPLGTTLPPQSIVVDPMDKVATVLSYQNPPGTSGRVGTITFVRDLPALRSRVGDPQIMAVNIDANTVSPVGVPLSATYAPDGLVDVLITAPPLQLGQPDCTLLGGSSVTRLRRYDPQSATMREEISLPYTTAIAYTSDGDRVLVQPCTRAVTALARAGQVVIQKLDGSTDRILAAPGTADIAVVGNAIISIGSQDVPSANPRFIMRATVRILEPSASDWSTSEFELPAWQVPYRVSGSSHAIDFLFYPSDVLSYGISVTPDRARALVLMRVLHQTTDDGLFLSTFGSGTALEECFVQWSGYTYHVLLINLQNGAREQDYLVGVQNQSCTSAWMCAFDAAECGRTPPQKCCTGEGMACFSPCDPTESDRYLIGYKDGYIPGAASVLFGRR
jgi:hypothetical protein